MCCGCADEKASVLEQRVVRNCLFYSYDDYGLQPCCSRCSEGLGEGYDGDIAFASAPETFGGEHNYPISVAFGGPVITKFTIALREIGKYKEVLRSQVEHLLNERLLQFFNLDLHDVKLVCRRHGNALTRLVFFMIRMVSIINCRVAI
ncbi:ADP-ribosylation factor GTPase-activating protein AGD3 [Striga asiatica]|uniref:ADP-ribosylation factor GTPase-activating protein AGD3 n=1 Tax=Striga asiatica TaxID=4170 RepID=A0A5A7RKK8_STRAF|nr:ADP-ribosylation factor GTPase-activating protein AGD3 [Striga asiatica]